MNKDIDNRTPSESPRGGFKNEYEREQYYARQSVEHEKKMTRLRDAAPELFSALKWWVDSLDNTNPPSPEQLDAGLKMARAAIKKAGGGEF